MDTSFYVFAGIGLFGFLFVVLSFILGEFGHMGDLGHVDAGGVDVGHVDVAHDFAGDGADHDGGHAGADHDAGHAGDADGDAPGPFSTRVLSIFLTTFGLVSAAGKALGYQTTTSAALGVVGGYALGWCIYKFTRLLWAQGGSSQIHMRDLEGTVAEVTVAIPAGGIGQVACMLNDQRTHQIARCEADAEIPLGALVRITRTTPEGVFVEPAPAAPGESPDELRERLHHA